MRVNPYTGLPDEDVSTAFNFSATDVNFLALPVSDGNGNPVFRIDSTVTSLKLYGRYSGATQIRIAGESADQEETGTLVLKPTINGVAQAAQTFNISAGANEFEIIVPDYSGYAVLGIEYDVTSTLAATFYIYPCAGGVGMVSPILSIARQDDCEIALLRDFPGVQYATDGEAPEVDGKIYRLPPQDLGVSSFTFTCKFKTTAYMTSLQFIAGASSPSAVPRFSFGLTNGLLYTELQIGGYIGRSTSLTANTDYIFSMVVDRTNGVLKVFKNGVLIDSVTDTTNIPPTGNFVTTNKLRVACGGDASDNDVSPFFGDTPSVTFLHSSAFSDSQVEALHKILGI